MASAGENSQPAILEIIADDLNHGQQFVNITGDGDVLLTPGMLKQLRLKSELWAGQEGALISLRAFAPEVTFTLNENDARLILSVPPRWYETQIIQPEVLSETAPQEKLVFPQPMSGFINYKLGANLSEQEGLASLDLPLELGVNRGQWLALNTLSSRYDAITKEEDTVRQRTTLIWDDAENLRTLEIGDFTQPFGYLLGGGIYGGLSWRKNYQLNRGLRVTGNLGLELQIESPTHAELLVNGRVAEEWELLPGIVTFPDVSAYAIGDAELVLTDSFGRVRRLEVPSYTSQRVLAKDLHDYAYGFGWQRQNAGEKSADYGKPVAVGYHRYGFGSNWSGGLEFAFTSDAVALGPSVVALIGGFSQAEFGFIASRDPAAATGYTTTGRYSFSYKGLNGSVSATGISRDYSRVPSENLGDFVQSDSKPRLLASTTLGYMTRNLGAFGISYREIQNWNDEVAPVRVASLSYRKQLRNGFHLTFGLRHELGPDGGKEGLLALRYRPLSTRGNLFDDAALVSRQDETGTESQLSAQKVAPTGKGWSYSTSLTEKSGDWLGNARGQYRDNAVYTASLSRTDQFTGSVSAAGGLAVLDGQFYPGAPITDSFAIVRLEGLDSATIANGSAIAGVATENEDLLVPDLMSYGLNEVAIDDAKLSLDYTSAQMRQVVQVGQRSGSLVTFKFSRFTAIEGELYLTDADGGKAPLEYLPIEYSANGESLEAFIGQGGYFYLENIPVGEQQLRIRRWGGDCLATVDVPDSEKIVVNVGEIACVAEEVGSD